MGHLYYSIFYDMEEYGILDPLDDRDLFCIHFIFLPRINQQLREFIHAWNHHPMRTEHNRSPIEIWEDSIHDVISDPLAPDHNVVLEGLSHYGIDPLGPPSNEFDCGDVQVPETTINLSDDQMDFIRDHIHPLCRPCSSCYGVDDYITLRRIVHALCP
jgi:hypothetical protein